MVDERVAISVRQGLVRAAGRSWGGGEPRLVVPVRDPAAPAHLATGEPVDGGEYALNIGPRVMVADRNPFAAGCYQGSQNGHSAMLSMMAVDSREAAA